MQCKKVFVMLKLLSLGLSVCDVGSQIGTTIANTGGKQTVQPRGERVMGVYEQC
jgi:hypothetical protein